MFADAFTALLIDHCTPAMVRGVEAGGSAGTLGEVLNTSGLLELLAEESDGGAAAGMEDLFALVMSCGYFALPLPAPQTMAARLLVRSRKELPEGWITLASAPLREENGDWVTGHVPCAMVADHVIAAHGEALWMLPVGPQERQLSGVPSSLSASLRWRAGAGQRLSAGNAAELQSLGAVLHAALLAGAMKRAFDMTLQYANDRVQFGKSIGKFQAVQHQLSVMAENVAACAIAAEAAFQCGRKIPAPLAAAVAKSRTSEAAQWVAATAHSLHGAIGVTAEYDLQLYTRRLHEWRVAHGSENYWNTAIGRAFLAAPPQTLAADFVRGITG